MTRSDRGAIVVPAEPFVSALRAEHDKLLDQIPYDRRQRHISQYPATMLLAQRAGVESRSMYRYLRSLSTDKKNPVPTDTYRLQRVEEVLHPLGIEPWMLYPLDLIDDLGDPEPDRDCPNCRRVTPIHGTCPWCDMLLDFQAWSEWVLDRAFLPDALVWEVLEEYRQRGVRLSAIVAMFAAREGMAQATFDHALRDEFRARGISVKSGRTPVAAPARELVTA